MVNAGSIPAHPRCVNKGARRKLGEKMLEVGMFVRPESGGVIGLVTKVAWDAGEHEDIADVFWLETTVTGRFYARTATYVGCSYDRTDTRLKKVRVLVTEVGEGQVFG